jgi:glycosyltransferase involved in cell wall biosynthesis
VRVALVPYARSWSYDFTAKALEQHLPGRFEIFYADELDRIDPVGTDLIVDFWWRGRLERRFGARVVKQVSSHRWRQEKYGSLDAPALIASHLRRAGAVLVPSVRLAAELASAPHVTLCPKGFHPETFGDFDQRRGDLVVGWAGSQNAIDKRLDVIRAAWRGLCIASDLPYSAMPGWYNAIDVITCASDAEGDPRPLIEGMACGAFPVVVDVGIVPELVRHGENGLVVERTPQAFADAFAWCRANLDYVRAAGRRNAVEMLATRTWAQVAPAWGAAFAGAIARAPEWRINDREERKARILTARKKRALARAIGDL